MKRLITILAASTALAGFATAAASAPTATTSAATATVAKPELGSFGFDEAGMRRTTAPGDNFFDYADGIWADKSLIPADQSVGGLWTVLDDRSKERTRAIIDELARDPTSKVGLAYNAYFDTAAIEARGLASIEPWLGQIRALKDKSAYAALVGRGERLAIPSVLSFYVGQDDKRPERYVSGVAQSGLGLPDRDYYISADAKRLEERAAYVAHLTNVLKLAGEANAAVRARAILDFETQIAKVHWTRVDSRDADKTYNLRTRAQFAAETKGFDLGAYLSAVGVADRDDFLVAQPSAVSGIAALVAATDLEVLKDQLLVRSLDRFAAVLPTAFDKERFAFVGTALSGTPEQEPRWKRAVSFVSDTLSDDISKVYVERHFTPATKAEADALVKNVVAVMASTCAFKPIRLSICAAACATCASLM